tara:strand:- start:50466 stop:50681 length:216 start_codon:yes stop_codon:yes gene_type:complete
MQILIPYLLLGLFIGVMLAYFIHPVPKVVVKYPNPNNAGHTTYIDDNNVCYKYASEEVSCPNEVNTQVVDF